MALFLLGFTLIVLAAGLIILGLCGDRSNGRRRCPRCWYDMAGTPGLTCPECGKLAKAERALFATRYRRGRIKLGLLLAVACGALMYAAAMGWPQLVPAAAWRAVMPYFDPHAEAELAATGLPPPRYSPQPDRWANLKLAYRASLVLDGHVLIPPIPRLTPDRAACMALFRAGAEARIGRPSLERLMSSPDATPAERTAAFSTLAALTAFPDRDFIADVLLSDRDAEVRRAALALLKHPNPSSTSVIPALIAALRDPDPAIRREAAELLGWYDAKAAEALPELDRLAATDPDDDVRDFAAGASLRIRSAK